MSGHTTGPWRVEGAYVVGAAGVIVRQAAPYSEAPDDLRLIAAAPMLLKELRSANTQMEMAAECIEAGRHDEALLHVRSLSRLRNEAIAAATGETK